MSHITIHTSLRHPTVAFAGSELLNHLNMLHADPAAGPEDYPVHLSVEPCADHPAAIDWFSYRFTRQQGQICGSSPRSVLLGVYDYLRRLGFVFLRPGRGGTYVPHLPSSEARFVEEPGKTADFPHRGVCIEGANSLDNVLDFIDWLPKIGCNSFFVQFKKPDIFLERWYSHTLNPLLPAEEKTREQLDQMEVAITEAMTLRGLTDHRVGHGWTGEAIGCANTGWREESPDLPPEKEALLAQIGQKRGLWHGIPTNTNLCYSNPEAQKLLIEQVVTYARQHPSVSYIHFWLADEYNNVCECAKCAQTTLSDQYVQILNQLDARLTQEGLDTKIVFLLYQELLYAPLKSGLEHPERFCLMFAPISRTFEKPYPKHPVKVPLRPYVRNKLRLPESVEENLTHYFNWKQRFTGDCFFYDYPLGRAHYGDFGYMKIAKVIYDDIHALKALGSNGYMSCQELRAMAPSGFPNYVMGLSLLDLSIPYEQMQQTYFRAMFGPNYDSVIAYLEQLSELSDTDYFNGHGPRKQPEKKVAFHHIAQTAMAFLMDMDQMQQPDPQHDENWDFLKFHGRCCILLSFGLAALCDGDQASADAHFREFCDYIRRHETQWQQHLDVYRIIEVATKYTGFSPV